MMKLHGAEIRYSIDAANKKARAGFTKAVNTNVEEAVSKVRAKSELRRRRDVKEATRLPEDNNHRMRSQEEEETSSSV